MKNVFTKNEFPNAKGGNLYEFKDAETSFSILEDGFYAIKVVANAKNAEQNNFTDDDDLRMTIDDYVFGKYEINKKQLSWKGFNTSASWNGANLKGECKNIYFFVTLDKGEHTLKFYADNTPKLISIEVFYIVNNHFNIDHEQQTKYQSFIFTNTIQKELLLISTKEFSSKTLKISINGKEENIADFSISSNAITINNSDLVGSLPFENSVDVHCFDIPDKQNLEINFASTLR